MVFNYAKTMTNKYIQVSNTIKTKIQPRGKKILWYIVPTDSFMPNPL